MYMWWSEMLKYWNAKMFKLISLTMFECIPVTIEINFNDATKTNHP